VVSGVTTSDFVELDAGLLVIDFLRVAVAGPSELAATGEGLL
jgi:hypothetical protein